MKKLMPMFVLMVLMGIMSVAEATVSWKGVNWDVQEGSIAVNENGNLVVTATTGSYGEAHYNTPDAFRSSSTPWVQVTYIDNLNSGGQVWMEQESGSNTAWTQWGTWAYNGDGGPARQKYRAYWWNVPGGSSDVGWGEDLADRTAGSHTLKLGMRADGQVDYWLDGNLIYQTTNITPDYFGDIYLAARKDGTNLTTTFTDYQSGTNYIPEPATLGLLVLGSLGLLRRKLNA